MDIFAVWGVKPDDVSFSISFRGCGCVFLAVVKAIVESTSSEGFVVERLGFVECFFVG